MDNLSLPFFKMQASIALCPRMTTTMTLEGITMAVDAKAVKELRERTGAGMLDCKKALEEANNDITKAAELLREKVCPQQRTRPDVLLLKVL